MKTEFLKFKNCEISEFSHNWDTHVDINFDIFSPQTRCKMLRELLHEKSVLEKKLKFLDLVYYQISKEAQPSSVFKQQQQHDLKSIFQANFDQESIFLKVLERKDTSEYNGRSSYEQNEQKSKRNTPSAPYQDTDYFSSIRYPTPDNVKLKNTQMDDLCLQKMNKAANLGLGVIETTHLLRQTISTQTPFMDSNFQSREQQTHIHTSGIELNLNEDRCVKNAIDRHLLSSKTSSILTNFANNKLGKKTSQVDQNEMFGLDRSYRNSPVKKVKVMSSSRGADIFNMQPEAFYSQNPVEIAQNSQHLNYGSNYLPFNPYLSYQMQGLSNNQVSYPYQTMQSVVSYQQPAPISVP